MSETPQQATWASMSTVAEMLQSADSVGRIEFYTSKRENGPTELCCRIFGLPGMSKIDIESLATKLNDAIRPVLDIRVSSLQNKAANQLRRFL